MRMLSIAIALWLSLAPGTEAEENRIAGQVTAKISASGKIEVKASGCAEFTPNGRDCARLLTENTLMRVASISKLGVAIAAMRLVEQKKLKLDEDISPALGFKLRNPNFPDDIITLRQLLSHLSSIKDGASYVIPLGGRVKDEIAKPDFWIVEHRPSTYFTYSNMNFVVIASAMERATGQRFDHLMQRLVLDPLKIKGCYNWASCDPALLKNVAVLYRTGPDETEWNPGGPWVAQADDLKGAPPPCPVRRAKESDPCDLSKYIPGTNGALFSPQGGLRIAAPDLAKFALVFLNNGKWQKTRILTEDSVDIMLTPQWSYESNPVNGETEKATMCSYGVSVQILQAAVDPACKDELFGDDAWHYGHLAEAYGLYGGIWWQRRNKTAVIYLITGTANDPRRDVGKRTGFTRIEEKAAESLR